MPALLMASTNTTLLDSNTLLGSLSEDDIFKYTIQTYAAIGSLGALVWDVLIHLPQDFKLATKHRINVPFIVYCISRLSALAYILGIIIASTAPIGDCSVIRKLNFIYSLALPSTLLLFVFRVCALYHNSKCAVVFFASLWIGLLVTSIIMPFGVSGYKIPLTGYCVETKTDLSYALVDVPPLAHDTIVFLATSWAFISNSYQDFSLKNGLRVFLFGKFLPAFSKTILRDGQLYYLSILLFNIGVIIGYKVHSPRFTSCTIAIPLFVLMNTLAGHIYRNIRLKVYTDYTITSSAINKNLRRMGAAAASAAGSSDNPRKLEIVFQRSTATSVTGSNRHSSHLIEGSTHSEVGRLDPEKQIDGV